jgi:hypothetical protein
MKVGIAVITLQKRELHPNLLNLISGPTPVYVHVDSERRGPAYGRNQCMKALYDAGCDYIAFFDDDTYPVKAGWQRYMVLAATLGNVDVFGYPEVPRAQRLATRGEIDYWQWCTGCFKFISRKAVEKIGYFNDAYKNYGHEDIAYLHRARVAGLTGQPGADAAPRRITEFIHSEDYLGSSREYSYTANMSLEEKEAAVQAGRPAFNAEVNSQQLYYPYVG